MTITPILIIHISAGSIGILSGAAALSVSKGGRLHRAFGTVFLASMLTMSVIGAYLAAVIPQRGTVLVGLFTFYFVTTAWMTVRRRGGSVGWFEYGALLVAIGATGIALVWGLQALNSPARALDEAGEDEVALVGDRGSLVGPIDRAARDAECAESLRAERVKRSSEDAARLAVERLLLSVRALVSPDLT